jgi:hypothetical protein
VNLTINNSRKVQGNKIARRKFPVIGVCERCGQKPAVDRHHKDDDTHNNERSNVLFVCRACRMIIDGRIKNLKVGREPEPARPCVVCQRLKKPMRRGRCHRCNEYYRRHRVEWSPQQPKTHCKYGHPFSLSNTWVEKNGHRHCRACHALTESRRRTE